jgi:hypothetical protein
MPTTLAASGQGTYMYGELVRRVLAGRSPPPRALAEHLARLLAEARFLPAHVEEGAIPFGEGFWRVAIQMPPAVNPLFEGREVWTASGWHATDNPGLRSILRQGYVVPRSEVDGGAGMHGIYCFGHLHQGGPESQLSAVKRRMAVAAASNKNHAGVMLELLWRGKMVTQTQGGTAKEAATVRPGVFVHNKASHNKNFYCVHEGDVSVVALIITPELPACIARDLHYTQPPWLAAL